MINLFKPIAFFAIFLSIGVPASANAVFPTVTSQDLNGDSHTLPQGFPGEPTIVFIAYKQRQQGDVNSWIYALNLDPSSGPEFVELPVVGSAMVAMKSVIDNGMRSGIVDRSMRARTITLYENASKINRPLGFSGRNDIRVLLIRQSGEVLWSASGPATQEGIESLKAAYKAAR